MIFFGEILARSIDSLHPLVAELVAGNSEESPSRRHCVCPAATSNCSRAWAGGGGEASARPIWYQASALEVAAEFFFISPAKSELFCHRQQKSACIGESRKSRCPPAAKPRGTSHVGRNRARNWLQSIPFKPDILSGGGNDDTAISSSIADGTGGGIVAQRQIQCHRGRDGGRLFEPESLQPGVPRTFGCCPGLYPARTPAQKTLLDGQEH